MADTVSMVLERERDEARLSIRLVTFIRKVQSRRMAGASAAFILLLIVLAIGAPWISPYDPLTQNLRNAMQPPSRVHLLGTDQLGRDILARIIYGSQVSIEVGVIAVGIAFSIGVTVGLISGYFGGRIDAVLMRVMDAIWAFPTIILALAITAALGSNLNNAMIAIGIVTTPGYARLARGQILSIREREYVQAARVVGVSSFSIMFQHCLPNAMAPLIVHSSLQVGNAIMTEASLSFLGLGAQPPWPTWGSMLRDGYGFMDMAPWLAVFPGAAIFLTVLAFSFLGDGLRDALDPRMKHHNVKVAE